MPPPPDDELAPLVKQLFALVNRRGAGESMRFMHRSGLTLPQIIVLHALRRAEDSISGLAARLRMSLPATSQLVDRLVEAELVDRSEHAGDRRVRRVTLRPAGLRFLAQLGDLRLREIGAALGALSAPTRAQLVAALAATAAELERELADPPPPGRRPRTLRQRRTP
jgi:MarR family transcriptional regulator, organic hydroperoxide resistance regulator